MNTKEIGELKRRLAPDKNNISKIYGCYVNTMGEIIAGIDESVSMMTESESEKYMALLHGAMSGTQGKNLTDILFTPEQVTSGAEHTLLEELRKTRLEDAEVRKKLFEKIIGAVHFEDENYIVLIAYDMYDVPKRGKDGASLEESDSVFRYIICAVCPVRDGKTALKYDFASKSFRTFASEQMASGCEIGFVYPAFDSRRTNIYNALYYTKDTADIHEEFIDAVFGTEPHIAPKEQKELFSEALTQTLEDSCSYDVVRDVHARIGEMIERHKESKEPEPLELSPQEVTNILTDAGVPEERTEAFRKAVTEDFGAGASLIPGNIIDARKLELTTPSVQIKADPEVGGLIETREIDGIKYILIPAGDGVEVNGIKITV